MLSGIDKLSNFRLNTVLFMHKTTELFTNDIYNPEQIQNS